MRLAVLSPPWYPIPPRAYGGIEAVVGLLVEGLMARGIDVTLFAPGDSTTSARLVSTYETGQPDHIGKTDWDLAHVVHFFRHASEFDLVHDHSGPLAVALLGQAGIPFVHTTHGALTGRAGELYESVCAVAPRARLVSLSRSQRRARPRLPWRANVPNAVDVRRYRWSEAKDDYLAFLGRISPDKGIERAIRVARMAGLPLRVAAKCREEAEIEYFDRVVAPALGPDVEWLGEVEHEQKVELLSRARALLFPIDWEEPFGLVMVEAMACGTPVVATRRGSVPEVVAEGRTGFVADDDRALVRAVRRVGELDPAELRAEAERRFAPDRLVDDYLDVYIRARPRPAHPARPRITRPPEGPAGRASRRSRGRA